MAQQVTTRPVEAPGVTTAEPQMPSGNGTSPEPTIPKGFSAETWEAITRLWHFLPDYPYEPQHQYLDDLTTDPDYPLEDFPVLTSPEHQSLAHSIYTVLRAWMPDHVRKEQGLRHIGLDSQVQPDIVVAANPVPAGGLLDLEASSLGLLLVVEVLSDTTQAKDRGFKMAFYAALGIQEYWLCNPNALAPSRAEAKRRRSRADHAPGVPDEARMEIHTLNPDGAYDPEPVQPEADTSRYGEWPAYRSPVLNRVVRTWALSPPDHVLQWWDETRGWMDLENPYLGFGSERRPRGRPATGATGRPGARTIGRPATSPTGKPGELHRRTTEVACGTGTVGAGSPGCKLAAVQARSRHHGCTRGPYGTGRRH